MSVIMFLLEITEIVKYRRKRVKLDTIVPPRSAKQGPHPDEAPTLGGVPIDPVIELSTALGNTVFLSAGEVNTEIPGSQKSPHLSLRFSAWNGTTKCDLSINSKTKSCQTVFLSCLYLFVANFRLLIPAFDCVTDLGVLLEMAITNPMYCKDAPNIAE